VLLRGNGIARNVNVVQHYTHYRKGEGKVERVHTYALLELLVDGV
jgi:hypothetical protein